ncbi:unnamed protein product [Allacma fusca]|uniref:Zinc finger PHD-type domain-containing protein n=1 Tax=Allacma fusca TaxID=39272 RepID=A0A8J2KKM5_9HEXA|nr:unnamed protein product [Allacma fusca]
MSSEARDPQFLNRWNKLQILDVTRLAKTLYDLTCGDARLLLQSHKSRDSVYGNASDQFFGENAAIHRYLIFVLWTENRHGIKEEFVRLGGEVGKKKCLKGNIRISLSASRFCWCKGSFDRNQEEMCVCCDYCNEWQHCLCSGITYEEANSLEKFKCLKCRGSTLPAIFVTPKSNRSVGKVIQQTQSQEHADSDEAKSKDASQPSSSEYEHESEGHPDGESDRETDCEDDISKDDINQRPNTVSDSYEGITDDNQQASDEHDTDSSGDKSPKTGNFSVLHVVTYTENMQFRSCW